MAATDYEVLGEGTFCPMGYLAVPLDAMSTVINVANFRGVSEDSDLAVGMAVMIGEEILRLESITLPTLNVKRGAADTIPSRVPHPAGTPVWFFSDAAVSDDREYLATSTVGVKLLPFSASSGPAPIDFVPPMQVTFNWRAIRPYPPGNVTINGEHFAALATHRIAEDDTGWLIEWAHRDRVGQGDQLIGHDEGSIGPEVGTTYTLRIYDSDNNLVRTESGISGTSFEYTKLMFEADVADGPVRLELCSVRDTHESWQTYVAFLDVSDGGFGVSFGLNFGS